MKHIYYREISCIDYVNGTMHDAFISQLFLFDGTCIEVDILTEF